ncbi:MAG: hypothetical protein AAGN66_10120 [Acidobacteriota bacterium]
MSFYRTLDARPLGDGLLSPAGSVTDPQLAARISGYKRAVAGRYKAISPDQIATLPEGPTLVSPKIDGQFWCLVADGDEVVLVSPKGKVISGDVPCLVEARERLVGRAVGRTILPGELFALRRGGRPRVADVGGALGGGGADVARLGFFAFDLLDGGDAEAPEPAADYADRLPVIERLLAGGRRVQAIRTERVGSPDEVRRLFGEWVDGGKGEGLVVRPFDGRVFKLKPVFTLDVAVVGFTEKTEERDHVRSILLALVRENGQFQLVGSCGNLGTDEFRAELYRALGPTVVESSYRFASSTGALYRFVDPKMVVEIKCTDVLVEDSSARPVRRMVLDFAPGVGWTPVQLKSGASLLHPIFERIRDDKQVDTVDVRAAQVLERVEIPELDQAVARVERPKSEIVRREVYTKTTKDKLAVRKLLIWRTHKEEVDPAYPPFVVHWTDFSPGRKQPLQREVRLAPDLETADGIAEAMLAKGVKRGWVQAS